MTTLMGQAIAVGGLFVLAALLLLRWALPADPRRRRRHVTRRGQR